MKQLKKTSLDFTAYIILGKFYSNNKKIHRILQNDKRFILVGSTKNLHEIIVKCQFGIISFGITVYETAALNIPTLVISHSFENHFSAKRIEKYSWYEYLGKYDNINYSKVSEKIISKLNVLVNRKLWTLVNRHNNLDQLNKSNEVGKVDEQTTKLAVIEPRNECIIVPTSTLGIVSDTRKQILQNTLEGKLIAVSH